ncbi:hypothetical protein LOD99_7718 [Oopsacas minuta]|uniref:PH domain-containing protein n=1 Tax=Oopsacas minuta TaxID=111878 RepID=A0AAV7JP98_9METZ|nr:hypothetical protein LOD99_7718 [Oopsacas minuta]
MCEVLKRGFLFMKMLSGNTEQQELNNDWERRWFQLHNTGVLKCYDSYNADQMVFRIDLKSIHVSRDDVIYPVSIPGKPWIVSVGMRERDEEMLLEADCEECMERWAQLILKSLSMEPNNVETVGDGIYEIMLSPVGSNAKIFPERQLKKKYSLDSLSPNYKFPTGYGYCDSTASSASLLSDGDEEKSESLYKYIVNGTTTPDLPLSEFENGLTDNINQKQTINISLFQCTPSLIDSQMQYQNCPLSQDDEYNTSQFKGYSKVNRAFRSPSPLLEESIIYDQVSYPEMFLDDNVFQKSDTGQPSELIKPSFLDSLTDCHKLLQDFWPMCFTLNSGETYLQLVDLTVSIEESLQRLFNCFKHSYPSPNSFLTLQVIGDLYQTYKPQKSSKKKGMQSIDCRNSFTSQGIMTSKIVRVSLRADTDASLNEEKLERFLYEMSHLSESEMFYLSWVSFVKGSFPVMNLSVSARHSACIFLVYKRITEKKSVEVGKFVPSHLQKMPHLEKLLEELERMHASDTMTICNLMLDNLRISRSGNAISLPVVKIKKLSMRLKYIDCIFVIGKQHIGITPKKHQSSEPDNSSEFWTFSQVGAWFVKPGDDIVFIKLSPHSKCKDSLMFISPNTDFIDAFFKHIFGKGRRK